MIVFSIAVTSGWKSVSTPASSDGAGLQHRSRM